MLETENVCKLHEFLVVKKTKRIVAIVIVLQGDIYFNDNILHEALEPRKDYRGQQGNDSYTPFNGKQQKLILKGQNWNMQFDLDRGSLFEAVVFSPNQLFWNYFGN